MNGKKAFGDYQTPSDFSDEICRYLSEVRGLSPAVVIEPTCGVGNFIRSSLIFHAEQYFGIEINPEYCDDCRKRTYSDKVTIINSDFFGFDARSLSKREPVLILGNPPWVNNSALSAMGSDNLPIKSNFKELKGLDALTGASNFDICEYILLQLVEQYQNTDATIAMLCKTSVARNIFRELVRKNIPFSCCDMITFDAMKVFHVNVDACLLYIQLSRDAEHPTVCGVFSLDAPREKQFSFGYRNGQFYSDLSHCEDDFDGHCCFEWRQGVKHDCAEIMELKKTGQKLINGKKETVSIEPDIVFPLIKSSMFKAPVISNFSKYVIVTQKKVREDTAYLCDYVPKTWEYLTENRMSFNRRKSSIYNGAPAFSMFGIGDYSYAKYKVGISGFYKEPLFSVLYSPDKKPVMTDDTSYFICFPKYEDAYVAMLFLNNERVRAFLKSIAFKDAKRPYTKKVLERIDFTKICDGIAYAELVETENLLHLESFVTEQMVENFICSSMIGQQKLAI